MKKQRHVIRRKLLPPKLLHIPNVNAIRGSALAHESVSKLLPGNPHLTGCSVFRIVLLESTRRFLLLSSVCVEE